MRKIIFVIFLLFSKTLFAGVYDVFGIGFYDVKFDGSEENQAIDFRYEDNAGRLFTGNKSKFIITPSFGAGIYDDGDGKKLGNSIEFRSTLEVSYQLENKNRIGLSFGHISNANIAERNPGVEVISLSYQILYD